MIYIHCTDGKAVIIIEPKNIEQLKKGKPMLTADDRIVLAYTPDMEWTAGQVKAMCAINQMTLDFITLDFILEEGMKRPEVLR